MTNSVSQEHINDIMEESQFHVMTLHGKSTIVTAKLPNGFVITESSSCVDPSNYNEKIGVEICKKRIENKLWELEGYVLQTKKYLMGRR